jgi:thioredoxin 1
MENFTQIEYLLENSNTYLMVLIFSAKWLGSTQILHTYLNDIAKENEKIKIVHIDINTHQELAAYFSVTTLPITILIKNRKILNKIVGIISKKKLTAKITELL